MIVRKIKDIELKRTNELFKIAFEFPSEEKRTAQEILDEQKERKNTHEDYFWREKWAAFEDDDKTMMSFIATIPYNVYFDGNYCKMSGIGGVSSLPQYRSKGGIRGCFEASLNDMYENDFAFSYLYPFSTAYYNKFGYSPCCKRIAYSISLKAIKKYESVNGNCILLEDNDEKADNIEKIKDLYCEFATGYNMMVKRENYDYYNFYKANPASDGNYTYLYIDENGKAKGLMSFKKTKDDKGLFNMSCNNFMFLDREGFCGLLNHALTFASYYEQLEFSLPADKSIDMMIKEWALYKTKASIFCNGMARVINVQKVLLMAKYRGTGSLIIRINDKMIEQNNKTFLLLYSDGLAKTVDETDEVPNITMDIGEFSRFILGTRETSELNCTPDVTINDDTISFESVFYKKPCAIMDGF